MSPTSEGLTVSDLRAWRGGFQSTRDWGVWILVVSLASLIYSEVFFETAPRTTPAKIGEAAPDRVHNIGLLNQQQNFVISSCTGVIVGVLMILLGHGSPDTRPMSGAPKRFKGGIECPRCRTISPEGTRRCDCGFVFT